MLLNTHIRSDADDADHVDMYIRTHAGCKSLTQDASGMARILKIGVFHMLFWLAAAKRLALFLLSAYPFKSIHEREVFDYEYVAFLRVKHDIQQCAQSGLHQRRKFAFYFC